MSWLTTVVKHLLYKELAPARHEPRLPEQPELKRLLNFPVKANLSRLTKTIFCYALDEKAINNNLDLNF